MNENFGPIIIDVEGCSLTEHDEKLLQHPYVGGVILFSRNYQNPQQITEFIQAIKNTREMPLLITVDQEGGRIQRFRDGLTALPSLRQLGKRYDEDPSEAEKLCQQYGWVMAMEMLSLGIDVSFAPVLDIDHQISQVIGDRSFHGDPAVVAILAEQYIIGMREAGMAAIGKHYPGHGGVAADTHTDQAIDTRSLQTLQANDLYPYQHLINQGLLAGIMPSHVIYQAIDQHPAGFSHYWLQDMLKKHYGFHGMIFSDDLSMQAAGMVGNLFERVLLARNAGCDFVLICNNHQEIAGLLQKMQQTEQKMLRQPVDFFEHKAYT